MPLFGLQSWLLLPALTVSGHSVVQLHHLCPPWARQDLGPQGLFWLDNLLPTLVGKYHIKDGKQQGLMLLQLVEGPVLTHWPTHQQDSRTPLALRCYVLPTWARPLSPTMPQRSSPALTKTTLWPVTSRQPTRSATQSSSLAQLWTS